jgi:hypothetical protein
MRSNACSVSWLGQLLPWGCGRSADAKQHCDQCKLTVGLDTGRPDFTEAHQHAFETWYRACQKKQTEVLRKALDHKLWLAEEAQLRDQVGDEAAQALLKDSDTSLLHSSQDVPVASFQNISRGDPTEEDMLNPIGDERLNQSKHDSNSDALSMTSHLTHGDSHSVLSSISDFYSLPRGPSEPQKIQAYPPFAGDRSDEDECLEEGWDGMVFWPRWIPRASVQHVIRADHLHGQPNQHQTHRCIWRSCGPPVSSLSSDRLSNPGRFSL